VTASVNESDKASVRAKQFARRAARAASRRVRRVTTSAPVLRSAAPAEQFRLVPEPVFLLSYLRSGSTMMRMVLNSHSQICAPLEMHLRALRLDTSSAKLLELAMQELRLSNRDLENMLWDRLLYDQLLKSGKSIVVDKTPHNTLSWRRIHRYWPGAKLILLHRHPVRMMESMQKAHPKTPPEHWGDQILRFAKAMDEAKKVHGGLILRYEELTRDPTAQTRRICEFLNVPWEAGMVDYGNQQHGGFVRGLGDWSDKIKAGEIQPAPPDPAPSEVPDYLREAAKILGYL
jgi:hypothetical protein